MSRLKGRPDQRIAPSRITEELRTCRPSCETAVAILAWYLEKLDLSRNVYPTELAIARETVRILEDRRLADGVSIADLQAAAADARRGREVAARTAASRIRHLLQARGHLPPTADITASRRLERLINAAPPPARPRLAAWVRSGSGRCGVVGLRNEVRLLADLEQFRIGREDRDPGGLVTTWMEHYVRMVPACPCPPIRKTASGCRCGATVESVGGAPQPQPHRQRAYRRLALSYLSTFGAIDG